jgi:hypothetical protein
MQFPIKACFKPEGERILCSKQYPSARYETFQRSRKIPPPLYFPSTLAFCRVICLSNAAAAIRVIRAALAVPKGVYHSYVADNNVFEPIAKLFIANGSKYNLINSAIIDLFESIKRVRLL